jgi:pimeloyl-ACP methyl ester carboxylesterase
VGFDPIAGDPAPDPEHPPALFPARLVSGGHQLNGVVYVAAGAGPHPAVMLLHGFPGYERNLDLAQALRRAGWTTMVFHYRGAWGSGGSFSFRHVLEDVPAALDFLRSVEVRRSCRVNAERIALVGHSMGGFAALMTAAAGADILGVASIAGWNIGAVARLAAEDGSMREAALRMLEENVVPLAGTSPADLLEESLAAGERWDLCAQARALSTLPLFVAGAEHDVEVPLEVHHRPLVRALAASGAWRMSERVFDTDHAFSGQRVELARALMDWLGALG